MAGNLPYQQSAWRSAETYWGTGLAISHTGEKIVLGATLSNGTINQDYKGGEFFYLLTSKLRK
jgi:hypothetical protein